MPEFGGWMIEAVPLTPYPTLLDAEVLLSCEYKMRSRRQALQNFLQPYNIYIGSITNCMYLGTPFGFQLDDKDKNNFIQENMG
jgi:hypothetical protein